VGLELNLLSFIPMLINQKNTNAEVALKYFLVQAGGSLLLLAGGVRLVGYRELLRVTILAAIILKVGGAPFHFWCPVLSEGIRCLNFFFCQQVTKICPLGCYIL